jgi:hypothetical protein
MKTAKTVKLKKTEKIASHFPVFSMPKNLFQYPIAGSTAHWYSPFPEFHNGIAPWMRFLSASTPKYRIWSQ